MTQLAPAADTMPRQEGQLVISTPSKAVPFPDHSPTDGGRGGKAGRRLLAIGGLAAVALAGALVAGTVPRLQREHELNAAANASAAAPPRVTVAVARPSTPTAERVLPGNSLPLFEAALFPRATGYIQTRLVDIGDHVKAGQLLAVIAAPDIDDQLAQARADLAQARANLEKAKADAAYAVSVERRYRPLVASNAVSQQEYDNAVQASEVARAAVVATEATIKVNEAAVQRYTDLQGFEKITAPFPGVITARNIDPGDLVSANSTTRELFHVMRTDVLRVLVNVPQVFAAGIKVGQDASVYQRDDPSRQFAGKVTRTADALDPSTRTLLTEVQVPNPDNALRPGMYLQVKFVYRRVTPSVRIPAAAVVVRNGPRMVAVLDARHAVHYRDVQLGRDFGDEIEVLAGLNAGDTVVVHPGDDIPEGTVVKAVPLPK
jgi:RND family efflux transporter MFP subunit